MQPSVPSTVQKPPADQPLVRSGDATQTPKQVPSLGRVVLYTQPGGHDGTGKIASLEVIPARIQKVNVDGTVNLWLDGDLQVTKKNNVSMGGPNGDVPTAGCWHWPPRV